MKPRTVILTLELQDCDVPLRALRDVSFIQIFDRKGMAGTGLVEVAQATATVAQPSTTRGGKGRRR